MLSAVGEAPLAADRGESALRATTSICSGDWIFGFCDTVEDTSGGAWCGINLMRSQSEFLSRTDMLLLFDTTAALLAG